MRKIVTFREFEEKDIDFIYKCKNDESLWNMTVGGFRKFSYEDAEKWVRGCMGNHEDFRFWAVCTNDDVRRVVGYVSITKISRINHSAQFGGIMIGDPAYQGGVAWIQIYQFVLEYVFEELGLNRLGGRAITEHPQTITMMEALLFQKEGVERQSVYQNGRYYDIQTHALLRKDYFEYKERGEYKFSSILKRIATLSKQNKYNGEFIAK